MINEKSNRLSMVLEAMGINGPAYSVVEIRKQADLNGCSEENDGLLGLCNRMSAER